MRTSTLLKGADAGWDDPVDMATELTNEAQIRTAPSPKCILCGSEGELTYLDQKDRLFDAAGSWNFKRCSSPQCRLIWLDPMPRKEDVWKAYANYFTHAARGGASRGGPLKQVYMMMKRGYLAGRYDYQILTPSFPVKCVGRLLYLFPIRRSGVDGDVRFLHAMPQGRLLDVGCGSGEWLVQMRELGWQVEGVDFDENAVKVARQRGLAVRCGALEEQNFLGDSFDAVTLNHVIEHVPDPVQTLAECARILKHGGKLVLATPNASSLGHKVFRRHWRGLEPPRHLHLFSVKSLRRLLEMASFQKVSIRPQIARSVIYESVLLWRGSAGSFRAPRRSWPAWAFARVFNFAELCAVKWNPSVADCVAAVAVKQ